MKYQLEKIADNIWAMRGTFSTCCYTGTTRMTIVKQKSGKLLVHSPLCVDDQQRQEISKLGTVAYVIAPNNMHYLYFEDFLSKFDTATGYVSPQLIEKKPQYSTYKLIDELTGEVSSDLEIINFAGHSIGEYLLFHKSSKTLITSDIFYNIQKNNLLSEKVLMFILGAYGKPTVPFYHRFAIKDATAVRSSLDEILKCPFERIVMAHGDIVEGTDVHANFKKAWSSLLGS